MSGRKLWCILTLMAFAMLSMSGCGGTSGSNTANNKDGYNLTVSGKVAGGKATWKTVFAAAPDLGTLTVLNAQDGAQLGTGAIDATGAFSNVSLTLPSAKSVLVFKAVLVAGSTYRTVVPIDLSSPPAAGIGASNNINISISQETTNIATTVSAMLGMAGVIGEAGSTLATANKTYTDVAAQVVGNGGQVLAYNTSGLQLTGSLSNASLLPARDASTLSFTDLNSMKFDAKIVSAYIPGKNPIVNFQVTDKATGKGISGLKTFGLHIAKLVPESNGSSSYWVNYIDRGISLPAPLAFATTAGKQVTGTVGKPVADPAKTLVASTAVGIDFAVKPVGSVLIPGYTVIDKGDGSYTAVFYSDVTSNTNAPFDASATHRVGVTVTTVATPAVTATFPIDPSTGAANASIAANQRLAVVYDFIPATGAMLTDANGKQIFARNLVPNETCNGCHTNIASIMGHTARPNLLLCDICHTPANTSGEADMGTLIHRIHAGKNLPVPVVAENVANPTKLIPRGAILVPYGDFSFPQDLRNCTVCHQGAEAAAWKTKINKKNCGSCHNNIDYAAHQGSQGADSTCGTCHGASGVKEVSAVHATDYSTPNNPQTPAGLVNFKYDLKTVTVDATTNVATITFRILSDGGTGAAQAPVTLGADGLLTGFTGGPSFIFAYSKSASNQAFTASADYNNAGLKAAQPKSVSLTALATAGTLGTPDANGYYTVTVTAAASGLTTGTKMRTVALQGYFTQVSASGAPANVVFPNGRHTISVVKTVTGDTPRRVVIDSGKCGACHEVFEGHGGNRNIGKDTVGEAVCTLCHVPNLSTSGKGIDPKYVTSTNAAYLTAVFSDPITSALLTTWASKVPGFNVADPTTYPEETNNFKDMIHGIHAGSSRATPLAFVRDSSSRGTITFFDTGKIKFPAVLKNCEACHVGDTGSGNSFKYAAYKSVPSDAQVTTDLTVPLNADGTVATTFDTTNNVATVAKGRTLLPNAEDLVTTPFTASCVSCHDLATSKMHMKQNGGQIKVLRSSAVPANEACATCHGVTGTASIYTSHRF